MAEKYPEGSVSGLCSPAATVFSLELAFIGLWGFGNPGPWRDEHLWVLGLAFISFILLILAPWFATQRHDVDARLPKGISWARLWLLCGASFAGLAVSTAFVQDWYFHKSKKEAKKMLTCGTAEASYGLIIDAGSS